MTSSTEYKPLQMENAKSATDQYAYMKKVGSAVFYGCASFLITVVNKTVLTSWAFPSFLMLSIGQMIAAIVLLYTAKKLRIVTFPGLSMDIPRKIFPLPLIYFANMMFGLGGTQALPLPMFTALRRFSILMTMILEYKVLAVRPSRAVQFSVFSMVGGALLAASDDLTFNLHGYVYVMITNVMTASNGVFLKKKLDSIEMGKYGIMFYNSLLMLGPAVLGAYLSGDIDAAIDFPHWSNFVFLTQFIMSCIMGFVLSYSIILCTQFNSALTTTIIGCLKNITVTYLGMFIGGDYIFSWLNCMGINVSVFGSLFYTYITFRKKKEAPRNLPTPKIDNV